MDSFPKLSKESQFYQLLSQRETQGEHFITIDRKYLIETTLTNFLSQTKSSLSAGIRIKFHNELGSDAGGLTREYYSIITKTLFDPRTGLFKLTADGTSVFLNPRAKLIPHYLLYLELSGLMLAKAIAQRCIVDVRLAKPLLKFLISQSPSIEDLEELDPVLFKNLKWILDNKIDHSLELNSIYEERFLDEIIHHEIREGGLINDQNKDFYVNKVCELVAYESVKEDISAFLRGFHAIIPQMYLLQLSADKLQTIISGNKTITAKDIKECCNVSSGVPQMENWFWEILESFSEELLSKFLQFVTGSPRLPSFGAEKTKMNLNFMKGVSIKLPSSATCSKTINIPEYSSKEVFEEKIKLAIQEGTVGFGFV